MAGEYECDQCRKSYHTEDALQRHIRKVHVGPRWRCPDCEYSSGYSDRPGLRRHLQIDHHYTKEKAMEVNFEQVKPRKRPAPSSSSHKRARSPPSPTIKSYSLSPRDNNGNKAPSQSPSRHRSKTKSLSPRSRRLSNTSNNNNNNQVDSSSGNSSMVITPAVAVEMDPSASPYPSQLVSQVQQEGQVLKAVWSGTVPKGATITHLAVPTPIIERHFIQTNDDSVLVKEVFLFQAPTHWKQFDNSKFEIQTPTGSSSSMLLNGDSATTTSSSSSNNDNANNSNNGTQPTTTSKLPDNREIVISINGDHEEL